MSIKYMNYKVNELFYSLKGEGLWTGYPMFFVRLAGCNLSCKFCDTDYKPFTEMNSKDILNEALKFPSRRVVITGGEPLLNDLSELLSTFAIAGYAIHLETNCSVKIRANYKFNWIAASPKNLNYSRETLAKADEVKILAGIPDWRILAAFAGLESKMDAKLYIMPLAKSIKEGDRTERDLLKENIKLAKDYCLTNPKWGFCIQLHKVLRIK